MGDDESLQADAAEVLAVSAPHWHLNPFTGVGTDQTDLVLRHFDLGIVASQDF
jgi:hypothetical protein